MSSIGSLRPRPHISLDTAFFWDAALNGRLEVQRCLACRTLQHPPAPACSQCHSFELAPEAMSGAGVVESYTIHHHPPLPGFEGRPVVALIRLDEGPLMLSNIVGDDAEDVRIGDPVQVTFLRVAPDYVIPQFTRTAR